MHFRIPGKVIFYLTALLAIPAISAGSAQANVLTQICIRVANFENSGTDNPVRAVLHGATGNKTRALTLDNPNSDDFNRSGSGWSCFMFNENDGFKSVADVGFHTKIDLELLKDGNYDDVCIVQMYTRRYQDVYDYKNPLTQSYFYHNDNNTGICLGDEANSSGKKFSWDTTSKIPSNAVTAGNPNGIGIAALPGYWKYFFGEGGSGAITVEEQFSMSTSVADSLTSELETTLSIALGMSSTVSSEEDAGAVKGKESLTLSSEVTSTLRAAVKRNKTSTGSSGKVNSQTIACSWESQNPDISVWKWISQAKFGKETISMHECRVACNNTSTVPPTWKPGGNDGTCVGVRSKVPPNH